VDGPRIVMFHTWLSLDFTNGESMCPVWHFSVSLLALSYDSDCDSTVGSPRMSEQAIKLPIPLVGIF